jgi:glutamine amidotransferase
MAAAVGLIDYQAGNIRSIENALDHLGAKVVHVRHIDDISRASHLLLPGVGAFGHCVSQLRASGLLEALREWAVVGGRPLLGICVGMQLLADSSEEMGQHAGLGWIGGEVRALRADPPRVRVPHVGWNTAVFSRPFGDFSTGEGADFYFDHSFAYRRPTLGEPLALCTHGEEFCAAVQRDSIVAAQFHPEKSQASGMRFLQAFLRM